MAALVVRAATVDDVPTIVEFNIRLAAETEGLALNRETLQQGVAGVLSDQARGSYYVACQGETVVGQIMHTREWSDWRNGDIWWIQSVYVDQAYRRRGVFRALYSFVRARAYAAPGVVGLRLYVEEDNETARETYHELGMDQASYLMMQELFADR